MNPIHCEMLKIIKSSLLVAIGVAGYEEFLKTLKQMLQEFVKIIDGKLSSL